MTILRQQLLARPAAGRAVLLYLAQHHPSVLRAALAPIVGPRRFRVRLMDSTAAEYRRWGEVLDPRGRHLGEASDQSAGYRGFTVTTADFHGHVPAERIDFVDSSAPPRFRVQLADLKAPKDQRRGVVLDEEGRFLGDARARRGGFLISTPGYLDRVAEDQIDFVTAPPWLPRPQVVERPADEVLHLLQALEWSIGKEGGSGQTSAWNWDGRTWFATNGHTLVRLRLPSSWGEQLSLERTAVRATLAALRKVRADRVRFTFGPQQTVEIRRKSDGTWRPVGSFETTLVKPLPAEQVIPLPQPAGRITTVAREVSLAALRPLHAQIKDAIASGRYLVGKIEPGVDAPAAFLRLGCSGSCAIEVRSMQRAHTHPAMAFGRGRAPEVKPGTYYLFDGSPIKARRVEGKIVFLEAGRSVAPTELFEDPGEELVVSLEATGPLRDIEPIGITLAYLIEALAHAPEEQDEVTVSFAGPLDPVRFDAGDYMAAVMPRRL